MTPINIPPFDTEPTEFPNLITKPGVHLVAWSEMDPVNYMNWADSVGMDPLLDQDETPVKRMLDQIVQSESGFEDVATIPEFAGRFCYQSFTAGRPHDEYVSNVLSGGHGSVLEHANLTFALTGISRSLSHELVRHRAGTAVSQLSQRFVADRMLADTEKVNFVVPTIVADLVERRPEVRKHYQQLALQQLDVFRGEWRNIRDFVEEHDPVMSNANVARLEEEVAEIERKLESVDPTKFAGKILALGEELRRKKNDLKNLRTLKKKRVNESAREFLPNWVETQMVMTFNVRALRHVLVLRGDGASDLQIQRLMFEMLGAVQDQGNLSVFDDLVRTADSIQVSYPKV